MKNRTFSGASSIAFGCLAAGSIAFGCLAVGRFAFGCLAVGSIAFGSFAAGCAGSETGNGQRPRDKRPVSIEMRLVAPGGELAMQDRGGLTFTIGSALAFVERIEFMLPVGDECRGLPEVANPYAAACDADADRLRIDGPWVVDLVSGDFDPPLEGIDVLEGEFDRIEMKLSPGELGLAGIEMGDPLDGGTLDVIGTVALGSATTPFGLTLAQNVQSRFEGSGAVSIGADADSVQLTSDVRSWFSALDLATCIAAGAVPTVDGVLRLESADRRSCGDVARAVRQALSQTGKVVIESKTAPPTSNRPR